MNQDEKGLSFPFKKKYFRITSYTHYFGVLDGANTICGFCGRKIAVFAPSLSNISEHPDKIFYGCLAHCGKIPYYKVDFIDRKLFLSIDARIKDSFPRPKNIAQKSITETLSEFNKLDRLREKHRELLPQLSYAGGSLAKLIKNIEAIESEIEQTERSYLSAEVSSESPLLLPFWKFKDIERIMALPLAYRRGIFWRLIKRVRFYDTYLILRTPYFSVSNKLEKSSRFGSTIAINLATHR